MPELRIYVDKEVYTSFYTAPDDKQTEIRQKTKDYFIDLVTKVM